MAAQIEQEPQLDEGLDANTIIELCERRMEQYAIRDVAYETYSRYYFGKPARDLNAVEAAFTAANPGLSSRGMAVRCQRGALSEVRICFTKGLDFRPCPAIDAAACHASSLSVPVQ